MNDVVAGVIVALCGGVMFECIQILRTCKKWERALFGFLFITVVYEAALYIITILDVLPSHIFPPEFIRPGTILLAASLLALTIIHRKRGC